MCRGLSIVANLASRYTAPTLRFHVRSPFRQETMHFSFVDRVLELQRGVKITTLKCLSMGEEYLADHFPRFPVMPGVLMLQAMTEASALLVSASEDLRTAW